VTDIARISAHQFEDLAWIECFSLQQTSRRPADHVNGFWHQIAGMQVVD